MSVGEESPEGPAPRGIAGWLRFGAVVVGFLATFVALLCLGGPLDALGASWGLPQRLHLSIVLASVAGYLGSAGVAREWSRPARRFLSAHGLPELNG